MLLTALFYVNFPSTKGAHIEGWTAGAMGQKGFQTPITPLTKYLSFSFAPFSFLSFFLFFQEPNLVSC